MANAIIVIVLVLIIILAMKSSMKHFLGQGGCCGGGSTPVKIPAKKLEGKKLGEMIVSISGMHCEHCVQKVTGAIHRIEGTSAKVNLKKNQALVAYDRQVSKEAITKEIEAEGFHVVEIRE